jgi:hypothetical protein
MVCLVRFEDWVFDRDDVEFISITPESLDGKKTRSLIVKLKNKQTLELVCANEWRAKHALDELTAELQPANLGGHYDHYLVRAFSRYNQAIEDLHYEVKRMMNSFKKLKDKQIKEGKNK